MITIVIICDKNMETLCTEKFKENARIIAVPDSTEAAFASINKLKIFEFYPEITHYKSVLFIDSDIIIHTDVIKYFEKITKTDTLYVYTEDTNIDAHKTQWFSYNNYTQQDMDFFRKEKIHVFNAGCFGFIPDETMQTHFLNIVNFISSYKGKLVIYEQSFMNVYFNKLNNTERTLLTSDTYIMFPHRLPDQSHEGKLIHFCGGLGNADGKHKDMKNYIAKYMPFLTI
jgi:lipopolysaccharide biosynthesis glycosyltransferase